MFSRIDGLKKQGDGLYDGDKRIDNPKDLQDILKMACLFGCDGTVKDVLEVGANPDEKDGLGNTFLHTAAKKVKEIYDREGIEGLAQSTSREDRVLIELLINGANTETTNNQGQTPIDILGSECSDLVQRILSQIHG